MIDSCLQGFHLYVLQLLFIVLPQEQHMLRISWSLRFTKLQVRDDRNNVRKIQKLGKD